LIAAQSAGRIFSVRAIADCGTIGTAQPRKFLRDIALKIGNLSQIALSLAIT
jgi:hypothetical protein